MAALACDASYVAIMQPGLVKDDAWYWSIESWSCDLEAVTDDVVGRRARAGADGA
jgi:hypothetical protein